MDIENLLKALDNEENTTFINLNTKKINKMKSEIIKELNIQSNKTSEIIKKLKKYMYIDEISELRYGSFIRWINIKYNDTNNLDSDSNSSKNIYLNNGGILCEINITDEGMLLTCRNFMNKFHKIKMDECLIFQKLSGQEQVLLSALDHINN